MDQDNASALVGKLLLAMPTMSDPRFERAVIYLCAHDKNGAMGLMVNQTLPDVKFRAVLKDLKIPSDILVDPAVLSMPIMHGGPVEPGRGFLLHSPDFLESQSVRVDDAFAITGTTDAIKAVAQGAGPQERLFIFGHAGWSAGQLDAELQQNTWLICESDTDLVFQADHRHKWDLAVAKIGVDPALLSAQAGHA